jgi:hypothetical protein
MPDEPPLTLGLTTPAARNEGAADRPIKIFRCPACKQYINDWMTKCRFCGAPVDLKAVAIDQTCSLPYAKLILLPVVFWAAAVCMYTYRKWVPPQLFSGWLFTPVLLPPFMIAPWLKVCGIGAVYPRLKKARRVAGAILWAWMLAFLLAPLILFAARPDLLGQVSKMLSWGMTHQVTPYPY